MLWLQLKRQINWYVNDYSKEQKWKRLHALGIARFCDKTVAPNSCMMTRIQWGLSEKTTKNTVSWHMNSRWMDVVKKEVRSAALQIKRKKSWCHRFIWTWGVMTSTGCAANECIQNVSTPSLGRLFTHLPSSSFAPAFEQSSLACASTTDGEGKKRNNLG